MMNIRNARPSDLEEMQRLFVETISAVCINDYSSEQIDVWVSSAENTRRWREALDIQLFLIAELDNRIVGYTSLENGDYLDFLYVHKDYQRQGIAQKLYSALEDIAKKAGTLLLTSDVSKTAKPFFEKNGFTTIAEQRRMIKGVEIVNYKMEKK